MKMENRGLERGYLELNDYREFQRKQEQQNLERINEINNLEKQRLKKPWIEVFQCWQSAAALCIF